MATTPDPGTRLVEEARSALHERGLSAEFEIERGAAGWLIHVDFGSDDGLALEVAPTTDDIRVLDPHDEYMTRQQWLVYLVARAGGQSPKEAWRTIKERRSGNQGMGA
ncbi:hypothetical protein ACIP9H_17705 [Streptomyces sp. NPDC088732]|uniref:hypothetical protein n=1 Tax=Streptomyces sp. NPDC088732 TaxID=3365879 RepID=UPI0038049100